MAKEDGRKNNGGNSTKSLRKDDKRKNQYRQDLEEFINENPNKIKEVLLKLQTNALTGDIKAITLYLAYMLGKPKESKDITSNGKELGSNPIIIFGEGE